MGGSRSYVEAIAQRLDVVRPSPRSPRWPARPTGSLVTSGGRRVESTELFDQVVLATHADHALGLLTDPTDDERRVLGSFGYSTNRTYLHRDASQLPGSAGAGELELPARGL